MPYQLDIFVDSRDVALRNELASAVCRGDAPAARAAAAALHAEFGDDPALAPAARLIAHIDDRRQRQAQAPADAEEVLRLRRDLQEHLAPAARDLLGPEQATAWLDVQWQALAVRARAVPWRTDRADAHAAALYLQGRAWAEAAASASRIESWRRIPQPLLWMTEARWRLEGSDAAWPLLAEALWLAPARALPAMRRLADARLDRLMRRFEEVFDPIDDDGWAWLPAWALVDQPLLAAALAPASPPPERPAAEGFRLAMALLRLERRGRHGEIVEQRRLLQALSVPLFEAYMRTR
jgi:hypothetical protein